jgi:D-alanine transaminase
MLLLALSLAESIIDRLACEVDCAKSPPVVGAHPPCRLSITLAHSMKFWLNGQIVPPSKAKISPFDRGFLFGDGVYEVVRFFGGVGVGMAQHVARLRRSLADARIKGFEAGDLTKISAALLQSEALTDAIVYLQVTRGAEEIRRHVPADDLTPTVFAYATAAPGLETLARPQTISCITAPDERWRKCSIKSISLMGNILSSLAAAEAGAEEAILHRGGFVSEGSRTNIFAVHAGRLITPQVDVEPPILHGVTRAMVLDAGKANGMRLETRPLRVQELKQADEIFVTSTHRLVSAVTQLDGRPVHGGVIGSITSTLFESLRLRIAESCNVAAKV